MSAGRQTAYRRMEDATDHSDLERTLQWYKIGSDEVGSDEVTRKPLLEAGHKLRDGTSVIVIPLGNCGGVDLGLLERHRAERLAFLFLMCAAGCGTMVSLHDGRIRILHTVLATLFGLLAIGLVVTLDRILGMDADQHAFFTRVSNSANHIEMVSRLLKEKFRQGNTRNEDKRCVDVLLLHAGAQG